MFVGFCGIWRKGNLGRGASHVEKAVRMMTLSVVVLLRLVESTQQIIGSNPSVEAFGFAGNHLNMEIAVRQLEFRVRLCVVADVIKQNLASCRFQQAHAGSGQQEHGGIFMFMLRYFFYRAVEQFLEVFFADEFRLDSVRCNTCSLSVRSLFHTMYKSRPTWVYLLGVLVLDLGQAMQFGGVGGLARFMGFEPFIDMQSGPLIVLSACCFAQHRRERER